MSTLTKHQILEEWERLCHDPRFKDCPHKVELTANGKIIMSPASNDHVLLQGQIMQLLGQLLSDGVCSMELGIQTREGIRSPDVFWCSKALASELRGKVAATKAPEICVEIMSTSNTMAEMEEKRDLYFESGCKEFILVDRKCFVTFFSPEGQLELSSLAPGFPGRIEIAEA